MNISIIVPVLNEAALIRQSLTDLRERAPKAEIIVVDGRFVSENHSAHARGERNAPALVKMAFQ
jgi:hypothetical protein